MGVVEDIIGLKSALDTEWEDIITTQGQVELLLKDGLAWWKTNEATMWTDFETAYKHFMTGLHALHIGDIDATLENITATIEDEIKPILTQLESLRSDLDPMQAIDHLLSTFPSFPGIPNPPIDMVKLPELNAGVFQSIMNEVMNIEKDFKMDVKPLNPPPPSNLPGPTQEETQAIVDKLFTAFENAIETFMTDSITGELEGIKTSLESLVEDEVITSIQTNIQKALDNLKGEADLTAELIVAQLKEFMTNELDSVVSIADSLVTNMKTDLTNVRSLFHGLASVQADIDSDFAKFFNEVFNKPQPTLLEAVSFVIAIPLTLTSQVTTGENFKIPQSAFLSFDSTLQTKMTGILQVIDIVTSVADKAYKTYKGYKKESISYVYKIFMGLLGTIKSGLFQVAFAPKNFNIVTHYKDNLLWYLNFGTGIALSTGQWMLDAYLTKENVNNANATSLKGQVDQIHQDFDAQVTKWTNAYNDIKTKYPNKFKKGISQFNSIILSTQKELKTLSDGIASIPSGTALKTYLDQIKQYKYPADSLNKGPGEIVSYVRESKIQKKIKTTNPNSLKIIQQAANVFYNYQDDYRNIRNLAEDMTGKTVNEAKGERFLNEVSPMIDYVNTLGTMAFKIYVYNTEKGQTESTLVGDIVPAVITATSDATGLLFYKLDPPEGSKAAKTATATSLILFLASKVWEGYSAEGNLSMKTKLNKIDYDATAKTIEVDFNYDVTPNSLGAGSFSLKSGSKDITVTPVSTGNSPASSFVLKLSNPLVAGDYSLAVVGQKFKDPWGRDVETSIDFNVPYGIESAIYGDSIKAITVTLDSSLDLKVALDKSFTLSSSTGDNIEIQIAGSGTTYTLTAQTPPFSTGTYHVRTGTGAFQDAGGKAVVSIYTIEVPNS